MAINYPGPYELRIEFLPTIGGLQTLSHIQRLNVDLEGTPAQGSAFTAINFQDKNGATGVALSTLVENFLTKELKLLRNDCDVVGVELWKYPTAQSFDSIFWSSYAPTANVGTGTAAVVPSGQDIYTFRSAEGGTMKLNIMEGVIPAGPPIAYAGLSVDQAALVDFILDGDGATYSAPFLARDTSYPFSFIKDYPGINERLWKTRNGR